MNTEDLIGEIIIHKTFGRGIIKDFENNHITVEFVNIDKMCKFMYPSCFVKFISLKDLDMQDKMEKYLKTWKIESGYSRQESKKKQYEKSSREIMSRVAAAKKRKPKTSYRICRRPK